MPAPRMAHREAVRWIASSFALQWGAVPLTREEGSRPGEAGRSRAELVPVRLWAAGCSQVGSRTLEQKGKAAWGPNGGPWGSACTCGDACRGGSLKGSGAKSPLSGWKGREGDSGLRPPRNIDSTQGARDQPALQERGFACQRGRGEHAASQAGPGLPALTPGTWLWSVTSGLWGKARGTGRWKRWLVFTQLMDAPSGARKKDGLATAMLAGT